MFAKALKNDNNLLSTVGAVGSFFFWRVDPALLLALIAMAA